MTKSARILALLNKGLTPQQVAAKVGCKDAYVRAVRQRATPEGRERSAAFSKAYYWAKKEENPEEWAKKRSAYFTPYHR
jgi:hypothetical protein